MNQKADQEEITDILTGIKNSLTNKSINIQTAISKIYDLDNKASEEIGLHIHKYMFLEGIITRRQAIRYIKQGTMIDKINVKSSKDKFFNTNSHMSRKTYIEKLSNNNVLIFLNALLAELYIGNYVEL